MPPPVNRGKIPIWVPFGLMALALIVFVCCFLHIIKRTKQRWPW